MSLLSWHNFAFHSTMSCLNDLLDCFLDLCLTIGAVYGRTYTKRLLARIHRHNARFINRVKHRYSEVRFVKVRWWRHTLSRPHVNLGIALNAIEWNRRGDRQSLYVTYHQLLCRRFNMTQLSQFIYFTEMEYIQSIILVSKPLHWFPNRIKPRDICM